MVKFIGLRTKTFTYLPDDSSKDKKKVKRHKKVSHKKKT